MPTDGAGRAFLAQKAAEPGVIARPSGLLYKYIEKGTGMGHPLPDTPCDFHYRGTLITGEEFDSSFKRGKPSEFTANGVVPGCTEGYQLMVEGDKVMFYIPSELAYGDAGIDGLIPSGAVLVFEVHLVKIKGPTKPKVMQPQAAHPQAYVQQAFFQEQYTAQSQALAAQTIQPQAAVYAQQAYAQTVQYAQAQTIAQPAVQYAQAPTIAQPAVQYAQAPTIAQPAVQYAQAQTIAQPPVQYAQAQTTAQPAVQYGQAQTIAAPMAYNQASFQPIAYAQGQPQVMPGYRLA